MVTLRPRSRADGPPAASVDACQVVHVHGGAFVFAIQDLHWLALATLATRSGATVHVPLYGLAPAHAAPEALELLDEVVASVRGSAPGRRVVLSGDSAGGGLALAHAVRTRDRGAPPVDALLLWSPWLDVAVPDRDDPRLERREPMLTVASLRRAGAMWAGANGVRDPRASPIHADLVGLPPITTLAGGRDLLVEDARRLHRAVHAVGGASTLREWRGGFHVFMAAMRTRESRQAIAMAADVLRGERPDGRAAAPSGRGR
ncbi:alpha/beta hydrolase fold domain-containing protein [Agrococcus versicolor]|uniref:alpha/beta hydrolase fold domain-containing protein n=1 Tax=Agrococcus versicolor TaxID=501482 RepID=UPI0031D444BB